MTNKLNVEGQWSPWTRDKLWLRDASFWLWVRSVAQTCMIGSLHTSKKRVLVPIEINRKTLKKNAGCNIQSILNKSWQQHPTRYQLYGHLPPITKTIQVRRTRHAGHCWRSRDELIRDVLLWIPTHGHAKAGRPARTYIQQLSEDTGCCPEDLPRVMNDREEWRERVRVICAASTIWWWWYNTGSIVQSPKPKDTHSHTHTKKQNAKR